MKLHCPECRAEIAMADVNVANDIALCRKCAKNFSYAELSSDPPLPADLDRPPKGMWFKRTPCGFEIGARVRDPVAFFLVPFTCAWAGGTTWMLYGKQIATGEFPIFESLFGIPFLFASIVLILASLFVTFGKVMVTVENNNALAFTGFGPLGFRRRFKWDQVKDIRIAPNGESNGRPAKDITIRAPHEIGLAWNMKEERQAYFLAKLRQMRAELR